MLLVEFSPSGGLFQFIFQLGQALAAAGHEVDLITGPDPELSSDHPRFRVRPILPTWHPMTDGATESAPTPSRGPLARVRRVLPYILAYREVRRVVRREGPDIVQWSNFRFPLDGPLVRWVGSAGGQAMVDIAHTPRPLNEQRQTGEVFRPRGRFHFLHEMAYRRMDAVLVLGERSETDFRETWRSVKRVDIISHGNEEILLAGRRPPLPSSADAHILFFGNLATYKGIPGLLDAFSSVRESLPNARLTIAGAPTKDTDLGELVRRAEAIGNVEMRTGYVPVDGVAPLFEAARVVVAPYVYANASGVVALAQTFGRPVVATDVGDLAAAVLDGKTGLLVPPARPAELAQALLRLLLDGSLADELGDAGRRRSVEEGSWDRVAKQVSRVFDAVTSKR